MERTSADRTGQASRALFLRGRDRLSASEFRQEPLGSPPSSRRRRCGSERGRGGRHATARRGLSRRVQRSPGRASFRRERLRRRRRQGPIWTSVGGAGVKAFSPRSGGRAERGRLDAGEHTRTLLARRCRPRRQHHGRSPGKLNGWSSCATAGSTRPNGSSGSTGRFPATRSVRLRATTMRRRPSRSAP